MLTIDSELRRRVDSKHIVGCRYVGCWVESAVRSLCFVEVSTASEHLLIVAGVTLEMYVFFTVLTSDSFLA